MAMQVPTKPGLSLGYKLVSALPQITAEAAVRRNHEVAKSAANIERGCKKRSRYKTGYMRGGWHTIQWGDGRLVSNEVYYVVFHEFGTIYMSAQPMLGPSIEEERPNFIQGMSTIYQHPGVFSSKPAFTLVKSSPL